MKHLLLTLLMLALPLSACAELSLDPVMPIEQPACIQFSCAHFSVSLPVGFEVLNAGLEGYEAAVGRDYPDAGETLLVATNAEGSASVYFAYIPVAQEPLDAAREAAQNILGSDLNAAERIYGENCFGHFACAAENRTYQSFFLRSGEGMLVIVACDVPEAGLATMLESLLVTAPVSIPQM